MPVKKKKRTFLKIKEKLVFIPPKKFFGRKLIGIICLICGSLILTISLVYFYLIPNFFPAREKSVEVKEEKPTFLPKRILIPYLGLDFPVEGNLVGAKPPLKNFEVEKGEEILILGQDSYKSFQVTDVAIQNSSSSSTLELESSSLKLTLQSKVKPPKTLIIEAGTANEEQFK